MNPRRSQHHSPFADAALAARLESLCASEMRRFAQTAATLDPDGGATWIEVAGGIAGFVGAGSPVNQAFGLGFSASVTDGDVAELERFYLDRLTQPLVGVCPLAHPSLLARLSARGWRADGFENVLARLLRPEDAVPAEPPAGLEIREVVSDEERDLWVLVAATGFSAPLPPLDEQLALGAVIVRRPDTRLFLAFLDDHAAGTGELYLEDGVAWLSADSTLPQFRGRGVQQALQRHRLALGATAGCDMAASEAAPGSISQRNMERAGFVVVYTRLDLVLPTPMSA